MRPWLSRLLCSLILIFSVLAVLAVQLPSLSLAGSCGTVIRSSHISTYQTPTYHAPTYHAPTYDRTVFQPVLVPALTFQYLPALGLTPVFGFPSAAAPVQQHAPATQAAAPAQPRQPAPVPQPPAPQANDTLQDVPSAAQAQTFPTSTNQERSPPIASGDAFARALGHLQKRCASCHTGAGSDGNFVIFTDGTNFNEALSKYQRAIMVQLADDAFMPPSAGGDQSHQSAMTDAEIQDLKAAFRRQGRQK